MPRIRILLFSALLGNVVAADSSDHEVTYTLANNCPQGGCSAFGFDKGYLFQLKNSGNFPPDGLAVFDPTGRLAYQVDIAAPDGSPGHLQMVGTADTDGTVLVPISYGGFGGHGHLKGGGVVVLDQYGKQVRFVDTARFLPQAACFGSDHSIWVMGTQFAPLRDGDPIDHVQRGDYDMIRKYSSDGKPNGSFLPRSLFPAGLPPAAAGWIRASGDHIEVMTYPGHVSDNPEWIELDLEGNITGRWKLGPQFTADPLTSNMTYSLGGFALTSNRQLFAEAESCPAPGHCSVQLLSFDRPTSTWKTADKSRFDRYHHLVAADGNSLVVWDRGSSNAGVHLQWVQPGQTPATVP